MLIKLIYIYIDELILYWIKVIFDPLWKDIRYKEEEKKMKK